jgi:DNA-binding XRE family transcriptional regulator
MPECGEKVAALKDRLRQFIDLSERWKEARATEGQVLRELRMRLGMTGDEAGQVLGIGKSYLSLIETGRVALPPEIAERALDMAERLGGVPAQSKEGAAA